VANGNILTRQGDKEQAAFDFYNSLLGTAEQRDISIDLLQLELPPQDLRELDAFFTKEEVWETIKGMPSDKAPGPDSFTGCFYKSCWPVIKSRYYGGPDCSSVWQYSELVDAQLSISHPHSKKEGSRSGQGLSAHQLDSQLC
jgi:hypothetical protein